MATDGLFFPNTNQLEISVTEPQYKTIDKFDRVIGALLSHQDVTKTAASTVRVMSPFLGEPQTFIVQTVRQKDVGDTISIEYLDSQGSVRLALPPQVADLIVRQRDSLTAKVRKQIGKASAAARKARGELPGFMKAKKAKAK